MTPAEAEAPTACGHVVSETFHSPSGVLFTFPSRYWFTIGRWGYLALESGLPWFPQDSSCPVVLKVADQGGSSPFAYGTVALFGGPFQGPLARVELCNSPGRPQSAPSAPYNPAGA